LGVETRKPQDLKKGWGGRGSSWRAKSSPGYYPGKHGSIDNTGGHLNPHVPDAISLKIDLVRPHYRSISGYMEKELLGLSPAN
jgi:hypothetical protein